MKKILKTLGIILIVVGIAGILMGFLFRYSYYHTMDGDAGLYRALLRNMIICFAAGIVSTGLGVFCLIRRR